MGWGAVLGLAISIGLMISMQTLWFVQIICLAGTLVSAMYGLLASTASYLAVRSARRHPLAIAGVVFAGTSFGIQYAFLVAVNAWLGLFVAAAAYSVLGAGVAVLLLRRARRAVDAASEVSET